MAEKTLEWLLDYFKRKPYWDAVEPFVLLGFVYAAAVVATYEYIAWRYGIHLQLPLFLRSYLLTQVTLVFIAILLILLLLRIGPRSPEGRGKVRAYLKTHRRLILFRSSAIAMVLMLLLWCLRRASPHEVSHIRVKFMSHIQDVDRDALVYLIYELNRQQTSWYFEVDFEEFNAGALTSSQLAACEGDPNPQMSFTELSASGKPMIGITSKNLQHAYFAQHRGLVSVITTFDKDFAPLSAYEYAMYNIVVQSILIHLDGHGGLPSDFFKADATTSRGGVFQFNPRKESMKSTILAAQLSPDEEQLLFNTFGAEYERDCARLLSLDWLHSKRTVENLQTIFGIKDIAQRDPARQPAE